MSRPKIHTSTYYFRHKDILKIKRREYYLKNKERIKEARRIYCLKNRDKVRKINSICTKRYNLLNKDKIKVRVREYNRKNRTIISAKTLQYYHKNEWYRGNQLAYQREQRLEDKNFNIISRLRRRVRSAFNKFVKEGRNVKPKEKGINYEAIIEYLKPFPEELSKYEIDHIMPLSSFNLNDSEQMKKAFSPENHQWLLMSENRKKSDKILNPEGETQSFKLDN